MAENDGKVNARWIGPGGYKLLDGTDLAPGTTVVRVGVFELLSDHWEPADAAAKKALAAHLKLVEGDDSPDEPQPDPQTAPEGDD